MKNVIPVALLSLFVTGSTLAVVGQVSEGQRPNDSVAKTDSTVGFRDIGVDAQKHYDSAMALSEAGRFNEAIEAFKQSLKLKPEDAQTYFSLGMTYSKSKAYKEAFDSFKKAVRYKPEWPEAHFRLGVMSYVLGKRAQSTDEYKKLLDMSSPLANILYRIIKDDSTPGVNANISSSDPAGVAPTSDSASGPSGGQASDTNPNSAPEATPANTEKTEPQSTVGSSTNSTGLTAPSVTEPPISSPPTATLTDIYRVGVGDILDVRFLNSANAGRSTLFTVVAGGMIDFPVAGGPIMVGGLTTDEIQTRIAVELKRRAVEDKAQISVGVRQYGSHSVVVTGLVGSPGVRILRREAVPLYVILAESQLRNDAARIVIMRAGSSGQPLDLSDPLTLNTSVINGDVITVSGRPQEFYYIAGRINYPGQKPFQSGITLLQAILAAGGTPRNEYLVEISREGSGGRLITTRFNLKEIKSGTVTDPKLQPGDRIEVVR